ncbi:MAG: YraN family protein [Alphaproteobacteria bacterium]|nr:MAG: YraN family protein [Alphaproteobacteria bacterium]
MLSNHTKGYIVEWWVRIVVRIKGYIPVAHRYRSPYGEIDLIYIHGRTLVFIEVKYRWQRQDALCALTDHQRRRIARAANYFRAHHYVLGLKDMRVDEYMCWGLGFWVHYRNTSQMEENTP